MTDSMAFAPFIFLAVIFELLHAWEEYHFAFKHQTSGEKLTGINFLGKLRHLSSGQSAMLVYKVMMVALMLLIGLVLAGGWFRVAGLAILGGYFTYQLHHIVEWVAKREYNPGLITASLWLPVVIWWWISFVKAYNAAPL